MSQVFKEGNRIGEDKVRVHRGGNRIDGVSKDNELFYNDLPVPKRSKINLSFDRKLSFNMGQLVPILCQECVPGDTFHIAQAHNLMFAPLISPVYQRIDYRTYYFFVPTRLVDDGWKDFITMKNPNYVLPYTTGSHLDGVINLGENDLCDYFDLPVQQTNFTHSLRHLCVHPFRAYNLIWNEYFRDEFKQSEIVVNKTGNQVTSAELESYLVKNIGWEKDYFTTCQTTPQVGADVPLPAGSFDIVSDGPLYLKNSANNKSAFLRNDQEMSGLYDSASLRIVYDGGGQQIPQGSQSYDKGLKVSSSGVSATINDLRMANHLQELRDKLKIAGARYNEAILAEYGVVVPDYRIQRPEYIGGFANPVDIGRIMQTTPNDSGPLGNYAGSATGSGRMDYIHYNALEHGYIIGLCCVVPRTSYDQGIPRQFIKDTYYDYYHPDLATLGDEQVYNDEIFVQENDGDNPNNSRFGYQQRYASYKYAQDRVNGEFRTSLSFWHMSREFSDTPALNSDFISADPTDRIFAVQDDANKIYAEIYQQIDSVRPMPVAVQPNLTNVE